jgi:SAM-dependent methyltransferase
MVTMRDKVDIFNAGNFGKYGRLVTEEGSYSVKERTDLLDLLPQKEYQSMVEFGCADCTNLSFFVNKLNIREAVGVDTCKPPALSSNGIEFLHQTVEDFLDFDKRFFDLVLLSDVLEHIYNPWEVLRDITKILSHDGILLISVPNLENIRFAKALIDGTFFYQQTGLFDQTHIRFFSEKSLLGYLGLAGFKVLSRGFRPDASLLSLKREISKKLEGAQKIALDLGGGSISVTAQNIEHKFAQQVLVAAKRA